MKTTKIPVKLHLRKGYDNGIACIKVTNYKKIEKTFKKVLTKGDESGIIYKLSRRAQGEAAARSLKIEQQTKKYKLDSE